jgi:hypothetical protein
VILVAGHYSTDSAVDAIPKGAYDYFSLFVMTGALPVVGRFEHGKTIRAGGLNTLAAVIFAMLGQRSQSPLFDTHEGLQVLIRGERD